MEFIRSTRAEERLTVLEGLPPIGILFYLLVGVFKPKFSIEVGAREAAFSNAISSQIEAAYAFEANPETFNKFCRLQSPNVSYLNIGVWNSTGSLKFRKMVSDSLDSIGQSSFLIKLEEGETIETQMVKTVRLDDFIQKNEILSEQKLILWIDAEGGSFQVLESLGRYIKEPIFVMIEVESHMVWENQKTYSHVDDLLSKNGFFKIVRDFESRNQWNVLYGNKKFFRQRKERKKLSKVVSSFLKEELQSNLEIMRAYEVH